MHRYRSADRKLRQDRELGEWENRVSGEIFIVSTSLLELSSREARGISSGFARNLARALKFYKHFAPAALTILILAASFVSNAAFAQRRAQPATASSFPSRFIRLRLSLPRCRCNSLTIWRAPTTKTRSRFCTTRS